MQDPWKHRSEFMKCQTCMWFVFKLPCDKEETENLSVRDKVTGIGRCRRHAPTMMGFPAVYSQDWCGDHKLDENKV